MNGIDTMEALLAKQQAEIEEFNTMQKLRVAMQVADIKKYDAQFYLTKKGTDFWCDAHVKLKVDTRADVKEIFDIFPPTPVIYALEKRGEAVTFRPPKEYNLSFITTAPRLTKAELDRGMLVCAEGSDWEEAAPWWFTLEPWSFGAQTRTISWYTWHSLLGFDVEISVEVKNDPAAFKIEYTRHGEIGRYTKYKDSIDNLPATYTHVVRASMGCSNVGRRYVYWKDTTIDFDTALEVQH